MSDRHHIKCIIWKLLWGAAAICFLAALLSINSGEPVMGFSLSFWYWNALVLGVLAIPIKLDCQGCSTCSVLK